MHLIGALASGIKGAESGTAEIRVRGSSTRATYYTDFEAGTAISTGADVSLDSNGGAEIYVNQYVDVTVKSSSGSTVRSFTAGQAAPNIEYIGQSFTGTDYTTGESAASKPVNLQTILDAWYTSSGALDFNVLSGGASISIQAAIGSLGGYFYNVKDSTYGATGDGATDDTTAITNAITAAAVNGGVVFFPAGTYRVTTTLTIPNNVSLLGVGSQSSIIKIDHATNTILEPGASTGGFQFIQDLGFGALQAHTGYLVTLSSASATDMTSIDRCYFGGTYTSGLINMAAAAESRMTINNCDLRPADLTNAADNAAVYIEESPLAHITVSNCNMVITAGPNGLNRYGILASAGHITGCRFDASGATGTFPPICINVTQTAGEDAVTIEGNRFIGSATTTVIAIDSTSSPARCRESNNFCDTNIFGVACPTVGSFDSNTWSGSRVGATDVLTANTSPIYLNSTYCENVVLTRTNNAAQTIRAAVIAGAYFALTIYNNSGGVSGNITFDTSYFRGATATFTMANARARTFLFVGTYVASLKWHMLVDTGDMTL